MLAVIPARGGSKRIPHKNIREFCGKPILAYAVEAALESKLFARVVVSTDDQEIAAVARDAGAETPFVRSAAIADDQTPVSVVTLDALERMDPRGETYEHVAQLMPTCPLRTSEDVRSSYGQFIDTGAPAQLSISRYGCFNPWWGMTRGADFVLKPLFGAEITRRSQDLAPVFCPTGAVWWVQPRVLRRERTFHVEGRTGWEIPWPRGVDIDTEDDWILAEALMRAREDQRAV